MRKVLLIGIGAGDPEHVTMQAVRALNAADVFFVMEKGDATSEMVELRREICDSYVDGPYRMVTTPDPERVLRPDSYEADVAAWHDQRIAIYEDLIRTEVADGQTGAFLVWGDPSLYDSTLRFVEQIAARGNVAFDVEVIAGISSVAALAAGHRIPLHGVGQPVEITTGRRLADAWAAGALNVVVMLDGRTAFTELDPEGVTIHWGAYLGTPDEVLIAGPLADVGPEILRVRAEAKERKGWMFDTYLLQRDPG
ncbi:precorrin-6A synthase (deacetylating) [soil metagenome]